MKPQRYDSDGALDMTGGAYGRGRGFTGGSVESLHQDRGFTSRFSSDENLPQQEEVLRARNLQRYDSYGKLLDPEEGQPTPPTHARSDLVVMERAAQEKWYHRLLKCFGCIRVDVEEDQSKVVTVAQKPQTAALSNHHANAVSGAEEQYSIWV